MSVKSALTGAMLMLALTLSVQLGSPTLAFAQAGAPVLATVTIPHDVMANGQRLPAGTYGVRLSDQEVTRVVGQSPASAHWVEFVQRGDVMGREMASVVTGSDAGRILKTSTPTSGTVRVDALRGGDYVRVWITRGATTYLVHMVPAGR